MNQNYLYKTDIIKICLNTCRSSKNFKSVFAKSLATPVIFGQNLICTRLVAQDHGEPISVSLIYFAKFLIISWLFFWLW